MGNAADDEAVGLHVRENARPGRREAASTATTAAANALSVLFIVVHLPGICIIEIEINVDLRNEATSISE